MQYYSEGTIYSEGLCNIIVLRDYMQYYGIKGLYAIL